MMEQAPEVREATPLVRDIRERVDALRERLGSEEPYPKPIMDIADRLRERYPDCQRRHAYHALVGSTLWKSDAGIIEEDFPGEDSVIRQLDAILSQL